MPRLDKTQVAEIGNSDCQKEELYFKLKNEEQKTKFIHTLFERGIPHTIYSTDIISTSKKDKCLLEKMGFELELIEPPVNLSRLSLEERNIIKKESREYWLNNRDSAIDEFLSRYGIKE